MTFFDLPLYNSPPPSLSLSLSLSLVHGCVRARAHTAKQAAQLQHLTMFFTVVCILIRFSLSYVCTCAHSCMRARMRAHTHTHTHTHTSCVHGHCVQQGAELCG